MPIGFSILGVLFSFTATVHAKSFALSTVIDQANDGNFCNSIYFCALSIQEISLLNTQNNQGYQIKDHTGLFPNGTWPQIYFAPDRYLEFCFQNPNLSLTDVVLGSSIAITHQINQAQGSKNADYDIKLEISQDVGSTWEVLSTNLWPSTPGSFANFQVSLPASYLNANSLNNLLIRLSVYGDDGYASLSSVLDLVELTVDYYNPLTNTPPANTINTPNQDQQLKGEITFDTSAVDDFGITEYQLNLLDKNENLISNCLQGAAASVSSLSLTCQIDTKVHLNGQYKLQIKTKDNAGEWSTTNRSVMFDNTPPVTDLSSILPQSDTFWKSPITISGTSQDNLSTGLTELYFKESGTANPWTSLTTLVNSITSSIFNWSFSWQPAQEKTYDIAASAADTAGNQETAQTISQNVAYVPSLFPVISNQLGTTPAFGEIDISWTTQIPTSGRVVYDTVSHPILDANHPNYSYALSSGSINLLPKAVSHLIALTGLSDNTIYYYRIVSSGSPTTISNEFTNKTLSLAGPAETIGSNSTPASTIIAQISSPNFNNSVIQESFTSEAAETDSPKIESNQAATEVQAVLGQTTTQKPKTWMLVLSILISLSYLLYLLSRRRKI